MKNKVKMGPRTLQINGHTLILIKEITSGAYGKIMDCIFDGKIMIAKCIPKDETSEIIYEGVIMSSLSNPYINSCVKILSDDEMSYIIQEKAECDLYKWRRDNVYSKKKTLQLIETLIKSVYFLHKKNIIHGDIKLLNLLLFDDTIKLTDFSLSSFNNPRKEKIIDIACTATHRPLEIWEDEEWDKEVDIWSLGCTIFEMEYGRLLFPVQKYKDGNVAKRYINCIYDWLIYTTNDLTEVEKYKNKKKNIDYDRLILPQNMKYKDDIIHKIIFSCLKPKKTRANIFDLYQIFDSYLPTTITFVRSPKRNNNSSEFKEHLRDELFKSPRLSSDELKLCDKILDYVDISYYSTSTIINSLIFIVKILYNNSKDYVDYDLNSPVSRVFGYKNILSCTEKICHQIDYNFLPLLNNTDEPKAKHQRII